MKDRWADFISSPAARRATIVLLVLQIGGCAVDLALSRAVGLLAIRSPPARPAYWALLAAIPIAHLVQTSPLRRGVRGCDGP